MLNQILYTACITTFDSTGEKIDYHSFEKLLKMQESVGNGILLLGSTGEGLSLTDKERKDIVNFVCKLSLNTQLIVGVPSHNLAVALEWLDFCNQLPIDGYLMTTPIYTKPGILGQTYWFEKLFASTKHPVMIYNNPGRAAAKFHTETLYNLKDHPQFLAIKDSSGIVDTVVEYKIAAPNIAIYCGDDYLMPAMAIEGASGLVSVASNAWPKAVRQYVISALNERKINDRIWWQACKALFCASNPIPIKALLKDVGIIEHDNVRLPLSLSDLPSREVLLSYHEALKNRD